MKHLQLAWLHNFMRVDTSHRAFAERAFLKLSKMHYEQAQGEVGVESSTLNGDFKGTVVPKKVSVVVSYGNVLVRTSSVIDDDPMENKRQMVFQAIPEDEAAGDTYEDELGETEMFDRLYGVIKSVLDVDV